VEGNDEGFDELMEEFDPYTDALVQVSLVEDIIVRVFDDTD